MKINYEIKLFFLILTSHSLAHLLARYGNAFRTPTSPIQLRCMLFPFSSFSVIHVINRNNPIKGMFNELNPNIEPKIGRFNYNIELRIFPMQRSHMDSPSAEMHCCLSLHTKLLAVGSGPVCRGVAMSS